LIEKESIVALVAILLFSSTALPQGRGQRGGGQRGAAQESASATAALPFSPRDLSGIWLGRNRVLAVSEDPPPRTPWGDAKFNSYKPSYGRELGSAAAARHTQEHIGRRRAVPPAQGTDIVNECNPSGIPRILLYPDPVDFLQTKDRIVQFFQGTSQWRTIWMDGRSLPKEPDFRRWNGYSVGHWEGDTLVVDSYGFDGRSWVDHFGYPHSDDMRLQERYRRIDHDTLELNMTITDPKIYTKPWVSDPKRFKLLPKEIISYDGWY